MTTGAPPYRGREGNEAVIPACRRGVGVIEDRRQIACLVAAVALVVGGTLATGVGPDTTAGQAVAGGAIVAGFGLGFYCLGAFELTEEE